MRKVTAIYYDEKLAKGGNSATGLILEFEDGSRLRGQSTDVIMPFEPIENPELLPQPLIHKEE